MRNINEILYLGQSQGIKIYLFLLRWSNLPLSKIGSNLIPIQALINFRHFFIIFGDFRITPPPESRELRLILLIIFKAAIARPQSSISNHFKRNGFQIISQS